MIRSGSWIWYDCQKAAVHAYHLAGPAGAVLEGFPVTLLDTAGIREAADAVERLGVERSRAAALAADIVVMVIDAQVGFAALSIDISLLFDVKFGFSSPPGHPGRQEELSSKTG